LNAASAGLLSEEQEEAIVAGDAYDPAPIRRDGSDVSEKGTT
jgi:hypothetical protein